jgi:hypothetical protein
MPERGTLNEGSSLTTIFSVDLSQKCRRPSPFAVSALLHCGFIAVVVFGFDYSHTDLARPAVRRYSSRLIRLHFPRPASSKSAESTAEQMRGGWPRFQIPPLPHARAAKQTLLQPDVPTDLTLKQEVRIPSVLLWGQKELPSPVKFITPQPKEIPDPTRSLSVPPSLDVPDHELNVADLKMPTLAFANAPVLPLPPAMTTPLRIRGLEEPAHQIPQTASRASEQTPPANLISISDIPLLARSIILPPSANQVASFHNSESASAGQGAAQGGGQAIENGAQTPAALTKGSDGAEKNAAGLGAAGPASGQASLRGDTDTTDRSATAGLTRITLPKDGKFGVVVMGSSASELYPESAGLLSGKVVYTVYVGVGLRKNWILQYSLPKGSEHSAAPGSAAALDAPWPFEMLRPEHLSKLDPEYVMVHGLVDTAGRLDQLALVFPSELPDKDVLLSALRRWTFRAATEGGQTIAVEVLLIIPRQPE